MDDDTEKRYEADEDPDTEAPTSADEVEHDDERDQTEGDPDRDGT